MFQARIGTGLKDIEGNSSGRRIRVWMNEEMGCCTDISAVLTTPQSFEVLRTLPDSVYDLRQHDGTVRYRHVFCFGKRV